MPMAVFGEISFGQTVLQASREPMTAATMTEADAMVMNELAGDDELLAIVSQTDGTTGTVTGGNAAGVKLEDVLWARVDALESLPERSERQQYTLDFYRALAENPRYGELTVSNAVNYSGTGVSSTNGSEYTSYAQMATFHLEDGVCVASYAGTGAEIDSWLEDGRMATTDTGVDAQKAAAEYLDHVMAQNPDASFIANGYSKGGNEALYAAIRCADPDRLIGVRNFDGPGFGDRLLADPEFAARYQALQERLGEELYCLSPENSLVGHLMNDHPSYQYIETGAWVFADHDYTTWYWGTDGNTLRAEGRTDSSIQMEAMMDGLIVQLSDQELDMVYDILKDLSVRYDIHTTGELYKLGLDENGRFSIGALVGNLAEYWAGCGQEERTLLLTVLGYALSPEQLALLAASALNDHLKNVGAVNVLGVTGTAMVIGAAGGWLLTKLAPLLLALLAGAAIGAALFGLASLLADLVQNLAGMAGQALQTLYNGACSLLDAAGVYIDDFFTRLQRQAEEGSAFDVLRFVALEGWDLLTTAADKVFTGAVKGATAFGSWLKETVAPLASRVVEGARTLGDLVVPFFRAALELTDNIFAKLGKVVLRLCRQESGSYVFSIDQEELGRALSLLRRADDLTGDMAPRLRRLALRLGQEGFKSLDGIFQTFLNLYHLAVSDIVVDLHDDIDDMVRQLSAVNADYSEMKNEIGRQAAALNS